MSSRTSAILSADCSARSTRRQEPLLLLLRARELAAVLGRLRQLLLQAAHLPLEPRELLVGDARLRELLLEHLALLRVVKEHLASVGDLPRVAVRVVRHRARPRAAAAAAARARRRLAAPRAGRPLLLLLLLLGGHRVRRLRLARHRTARRARG